MRQRGARIRPGLAVSYLVLGVTSEPHGYRAYILYPSDLPCWHAQGQLVAIQMLNCIIAAFSQVGNLARAFETFEAASGLGLAPDTDSYNALMEGLVSHGQAAALPKVQA